MTTAFSYRLLQTAGLLLISILLVNGQKYPTIGSIERLHSGLDALVPRNATMEIVAQGFDWIEGPIWVPNGGYVLFSDIPPNKIYRWKEGEGHKLYLTPSGYTSDIRRGGEVGSNGLNLDPYGRLVLAQHGDRRVAYMNAPLDAPSPCFNTLASHYEGKRLNSPNDIVYHSNGDLYFTDPPFGLEKGIDDPFRELSFQGIYRLDSKGTVTLLTKELSRPNGLAFSPDERTLYVSNSDTERAIYMAYDVKPDGTLGAGRVLYDTTPLVKRGIPGLPDGIKVDQRGNLFTAAPGGIHVLRPDGTLLGTFNTTQRTSNCAFGDDGSSLYITADLYLLRIRLTTKGTGF